jgi:hypothetical protein
MTIEINLDKKTKYTPESLVGRIVLLEERALWTTIGKARRVVSCSGQKLVTEDVGGIVWRDGNYVIDHAKLPSDDREFRKIRDVAAVCDTVEEVLHIRHLTEDFDDRFTVFKKAATRALLDLHGTCIDTDAS